MSEWKHKLYYGDNLVWLRSHEHFPTESVDLIYLDPPFNSSADYNIIFKEPTGDESQAQIKAFGDTWKWEREASEIALQELMTSSPDIAELISWIALAFLGRKCEVFIWVILTTICVM
jgi:site-specific DNA-methyltransferase (adenine-specific)